MRQKKIFIFALLACTLIAAGFALNTARARTIHGDSWAKAAPAVSVAAAMAMVMAVLFMMLPG